MSALVHLEETHSFGMFEISHTFPCTMRIRFSHVLGTVWISASGQICKKPGLWNVLFSHTSLVLSKFTFPMFWRQ